MAQTSDTSQYAKGSIGNPYTHSEFLELLHNRKWKGGFVKVSEGMIVYVFENGSVNRADEWGIDGSKFTSGSDFFEDESEGSSESGSDIGSGSSSESGSDAGPGSGSGSNVDDETQPRVHIWKGEKTVDGFHKSYSYKVKFRWSDGFYMENTRVCTSSLSSFIEEMQTKDPIAGCQTSTTWDGAYRICFKLKILFSSDKLEPVKDMQYVTIEQSDLIKRG